MQFFRWTTSLPARHFRELALPRLVRSPGVASTSQSQGVGERLHQTLSTKVRTVRITVASTFGLGQDVVQVDHPSVPWIVKHYLGGSTACSSMAMVSSQSTGDTGLADFGEKVFFKAHCKHFTTKAGPSFSPGFWIGRDPDSGAHLGMSSAGIFKARTVKVMQPSERISAGFLERSTAVPWNPKRDGPFDPSFFFQMKHLPIANRHPPSNQEPAPPARVIQESGMELQVRDNRDAVFLEPERTWPTSTSNDESQRRAADDVPQDNLDERRTSRRRVDEQPHSSSSVRPRRPEGREEKERPHISRKVEDDPSDLEADFIHIMAVDGPTSDRDFQFEMAVAKEE